MLCRLHCAMEIPVKALKGLYKTDKDQTDLKIFRELTRSPIASAIHVAS